MMEPRNPAGHGTSSPQKSPEIAILTRLESLKKMQLTFATMNRLHPTGANVLKRFATCWRPEANDLLTVMFCHELTTAEFTGSSSSGRIIGNLLNGWFKFVADLISLTFLPRSLVDSCGDSTAPSKGLAAIVRLAQAQAEERKSVLGRQAGRALNTLM